MLLWTFVYRCLFEHLFSFTLDIFLGTLGHVVILCLSCWGTVILFSTVTASFYILSSNVWRFRFHYILTNIFFYCHSSMFILASCVVRFPFSCVKVCFIYYQALLLSVHMFIIFISMDLFYSFIKITFLLCICNNFGFKVCFPWY